MKDLAGMEYNKKSKINISPAVLKLVIVLILGLFVVFFIKSRTSQSGNSVSSGGSVILSDAPRDLTPVSVGASNLDAKGVDLKSQDAVMKIVRREVVGNAKATRSFGGGTYVLSVTANLPDPKADYYEIWLTDGSQLVPIDYMRGSGSSWSLDLNDTDKYSKLNGIWITLERTKDNKPEEHIIEGSF